MTTLSFMATSMLDLFNHCTRNRVTSVLQLPCRSLTFTVRCPSASDATGGTMGMVTMPSTIGEAYRTRFVPRLYDPSGTSATIERLDASTPEYASAIPTRIIDRGAAFALGRGLLTATVGRRSS